MLTRIQIWNPNDHVWKDLETKVAAATAAAPGLVFQVNPKEVSLKKVRDVKGCHPLQAFNLS